MRKIEKAKKKISNYFFDHRIQYHIVHEGYCLFLCALSGIIFAFGFACFTTAYGGELRFVTGGASGISQNIILICEILGVKNISQSDLYSLLYFVINIPILVFAFFKISKRFAIYSAISVGMSSLFVSIFTNSIANEIAMSAVLQNSAITRVLIAGACTGISAAVAFKADISCGGVDIISYYFSIKKSTTVGKFGLIINGFVILLYTILLVSTNQDTFANGLLVLLHSILYQFVANLVIDVIHVRNKKDKIEIITNNPNLSDVLLSFFPHSATIIDAVGAYSNSKKICINMVVSANEVKKVINVCRKADEGSFITVTPLRQVYGNFFTRPVE